MTPSVRHILTQLDLAIATESQALAEFYLEQLRKELDPAVERIATLNHEAAANHGEAGEG